MVRRQYAVLIADVVGSRTRRNLRAVVGERLEKASRAESRGRLIRLPYAITAGDEFQTIAWSCGRLAELIFDLRERMWPLRLRMGIGIGNVSGKLQRPGKWLGGGGVEMGR